MARKHIATNASVDPCFPCLVSHLPHFYCCPGVVVGGAGGRDVPYNSLLKVSASEFLVNQPVFLSSRFQPAWPLFPKEVLKQVRKVEQIGVSSFFFFFF